MGFEYLRCLIDNGKRKTQEGKKTVASRKCTHGACHHPGCEETATGGIGIQPPQLFVHQIRTAGGIATVCTADAEEGDVGLEKFGACLVDRTVGIGGKEHAGI